MRYIYPSVSLGTLSGLFGLTRQAYYAFIKRSMRNKLRDEQVLLMIQSIREVHPRMGTRKMYELLGSEMKTQGIKMGRDKLFSLLSDNQLLVRKIKRKTRTTNSYHHYYKYTNLIKDFTPYKSHQVWVSDITYVKTGNEYCYLFLITDAYSRKIVGYQVSKDLGTNHAIKALKMATRNAVELEGLIHHSDRGVQYCSHNYVNLCQDKGIRLSMGEVGNPLENAIAERINGIIKDEYLLPLKIQDYSTLVTRVDQAVYRYNNLRPHMSCNMMTPNKAHKEQGILKRKWKNYYQTSNINLS